MAGYVRTQPPRIVVDEIITSGTALRTGTTGWTAQSGSIRYNSWATPRPPSSSAFVLASTLSSSNSTTTVTTGITAPDYPRAVRVCASTSALATGAVLVNGTDQFGATVQDSINMGGVGGAAGVDGILAFKTITSIVLPAGSSGSGTYVMPSYTVGLSNVFGLDRLAGSVGAVVRGVVNGTVEATAPLIGIPASSYSGGGGGLASAARATAKISSAATSSAGALVEIFYVPQDMTHA